jgi:hypothetical protein
VSGQGKKVCIDCWRELQAHCGLLLDGSNDCGAYNM